MALTSKFGFTNVTESTHSVTPTDVKPVTCYARIEDEPTSCMMSNKTTSLDQGEILSYRCQPVAKVSTALTNQHPSLVPAGVQYVIKLDELLRTTDSSGNIVCDEPVVAYLTIRHQASGNISSDLVAQVVERLIGACRHVDGTWRFNELMRSALAPTED